MKQRASQWTPTPPTEPGWYWARIPKIGVYVVLVDDRGIVWEAGEDNKSDKLNDWLWWPVPLTPPVVVE